MKRINKEKFSVSLYREMDRNKLSASDVAAYLDISEQAVYGWLGAKFFPKLDKFVSLAGLLNADINELLPIEEVEGCWGEPKGEELEKMRLKRMKSELIAA